MGRRWEKVASNAHVCTRLKDTSTRQHRSGSVSLRQHVKLAHPASSGRADQNKLRYHRVGSSPFPLFPHFSRLSINWVKCRICNSRPFCLMPPTSRITSETQIASRLQSVCSQHYPLSLSLSLHFIFLFPRRNRISGAALWTPGRCCIHAKRRCRYIGMVCM